MLRAGLALLAALAMMLGSSPPSRADDASLGRVGETVQPIAQGQVAMVSESVVVTVSPGQSQVEATFRFRNDGGATAVLMGFPEPRPDPERESGDDFRLHDFEATVDGALVEVTREEAVAPQGSPAAQGGSVPQAAPAPPDYAAWYTFTVPFQPGQERQVTNRYWVKNNQWSNGEAASGYILATGASWKGAIGEVEVRLKLAEGLTPYHLLGASPTSYRFDGSDLVWRWTALEPERNISLRFNRFREFIEVESLLQGGFMALTENGAFAEALSLLESAVQGRDLAAEEARVVDFARGRILCLLGREEEAVPFWERVRQKVVPAFPERSFSLDIPFAAAYYHLGTRLARLGRTAEAVELYREARAKRISPQVLRYLEGLLPPGESRGSAPVIEELRVASLMPGDPQLHLVGTVSDPDGDLDQVEFEVWQVVDGKRVDLKLPALEDPWAQEYERSFRIWLGEESRQDGTVVERPILGPVVGYRLRARDGRGNVTDSGPLEWTRDEAAPPAGSAAPGGSPKPAAGAGTPPAAEGDGGGVQGAAGALKPVWWTLAGLGLAATAGAAGVAAARRRARRRRRQPGRE